MKIYVGTWADGVAPETHIPIPPYGSLVPNGMLEVQEMDKDIRRPAWTVWLIQ